MLRNVGRVALRDEVAMDPAIDEDEDAGGAGGDDGVVAY